MMKHLNLICSTVINFITKSSGKIPNIHTTYWEKVCSKDGSLPLVWGWLVSQILWQMCLPTNPRSLRNLKPQYFFSFLLLMSCISSLFRLLPSNSFDELSNLWLQTVCLYTAIVLICDCPLQRIILPFNVLYPYLE